MIPSVGSRKKLDRKDPKTVEMAVKIRIDLLYLDGPHPDREDGRRWHFDAYQAAPMNQRGVVLIDDTDLPRLGKAEFVVPAALEDGFQVVASDRQTLLVR